MSNHQIKIDYDRVVELTRAGWSSARIAEHLGCNKRSVVRIRVKRDMVVRPRATLFSEAERARGEALFTDGCSMFEVARTLGRNPTTIRRYFPGRGWTPAQIGEYAAVRRHELSLV